MEIGTKKPESSETFRLLVKRMSIMTYLFHSR